MISAARRNGRGQGGVSAGCDTGDAGLPGGVVDSFSTLLERANSAAMPKPWGFMTAALAIYSGLTGSLAFIAAVLLFALAPDPYRGKQWFALGFALMSFLILILTLCIHHEQKRCRLVRRLGQHLRRVAEPMGSASQMLSDGGGT